MEWDPELTVLAFVLLLVRVGAFSVSFPLLSEGFVPRFLKFGFCLTLTLVWLPQYVAGGLRFTEVTWTSLGIGIVYEACIGTALGLVLGLIMLPMKLAGIYVGEEMGFNMGGITSPGSSSRSNEIGAVIEALGILVLFATETHHAVLASLHATITSPSAVTHLLEYALNGYAHGLTQTHEVGLLVVAPVAVCLFATTLTLGLSMKAVPNVNLFSVGIPTRLAVGFVALFLFLPSIIQFLVGYFQSIANIFHWAM